MLDFLNDAGFMAHGFCLLWQPWLIALYAGSDLLIFAAYTAIPLALFDLLRRRPDLRDGRLVALFGGFILLCGLTHLVSVVTLFVPLYPLHGVLKLLTGLVSVATALVLFPLVPKLAALPHPAELAAANDALRREAEGHRRTLGELRRARTRLEEEVEARTAELAETNERLRAVTRETVHRKKNLLTVVQALARQTARACPEPQAFNRAFKGRLDALARAWTAAIGENGEPAGDLRGILHDQIAHCADDAMARVSLSGPRVAVTPEAGQQIALAAHELATNALKYGALRGASGRISLSWRIAPPAGDGERLVLDWRETFEAGGAVAGEGLGTALLTRVVPSQLGGRAVRELGENGLTWRLEAPLSRISPQGPKARGAGPPEAGADDLAQPLRA